MKDALEERDRDSLAEIPIERNKIAMKKVMLRRFFASIGMFFFR